ncbi:MAG: hypothetical protein GXC73_15225 [Chitinophagaceae bacterium]|nr:hypothetical protein [Chitinophagaceae bacterium]
MKYFLMLLLQYCFLCNTLGQSKIIYLVNGNITEEKFKQYLKNLISVEYENDAKKIDSILLNNWDIYFKQSLLTISSELSKNDSLIISRSFDTLISKINQTNWKPRSGENTFNLNTFKINRKATSLLGDNVRLQTQNYGDTISFKTIKYTVIEHTNDSLILGYTCKKFSITEILIDTSANICKREIIVWATKKIQPALSLYGILWFRKQILANWTPLYVQEDYYGPDYYTIFTQAIKISKE